MIPPGVLNLGETVPMENRQSTPASQDQEDTVTKLLDHLLDGIDPGIMSQHDLEGLRQLRHRYQEIETGLSLGRRLVQGRLDIVLAEAKRRASDGDAEAEALLARLPELLSQHSRSEGRPRIIPDTDIPDFVDVFTNELDHVVTAGELSNLGELSDQGLIGAVNSLEALERQLSVKRHELHRLIDEVQEEIVSRYRSGSASVDDLLR